MPGITRSTDTAAGKITGNANKVFANGLLVACQGATVAPHSPCPDVPVHCSATMVAGSKRVFSGGKAVVNAGDSATCGHTSTGSSNVNVGD